MKKINKYRNLKEILKLLVYYVALIISCLLCLFVILYTYNIMEKAILTKKLATIFVITTNFLIITLLLIAILIIWVIKNK